MEELRLKLYHYMEKYGCTDKRTLAISQKLDEIIAVQQWKKIQDECSYISSL